MTSILNAVYLGNTHGDYRDFTVGKEYKVYNCNIEHNYIEVYDDDGDYRHIKNGAFHKFKLSDNDVHFATETECEYISSAGDKKPYLRYYINGHEVGVIEFGNVGRTVYELDLDGVKCDTIKFEVKFE